MDSVQVRPMTEADVSEAEEVTFEALRTSSAALGRPYPQPTEQVHEQRHEQRRERLRHGLRHDPDGCWVAVDAEGAVLGAALATRRASYWWLSLLAVGTDRQAQGVGARLMAAALGTFTQAGGLCASDDPKALRRYRAAGFRLSPCYAATGPLDRSLLPVVEGVRPGDVAVDRELVERVALAQRGAPHGPDLDAAVERGTQLFVVEAGGGAGYVLAGPGGPAVLAATEERLAADLLWTALAQASEPETTVMWMDAGQQWALDVTLAARLPLALHGTRCTRGPVGPMRPYLPNGGLG